MYDKKAYLRDNSQDDVSGVAIAQVDEDDGYRVAENRESGWCKPFWISQEDFEAHELEYVGILSEDQFVQIVA